jgi:hypothetical protein
MPEEKHDLHNMTHVEAEKHVETLIDRHINAGIMFRFVTGHSEAMQKIVIKAAEQYQLTYARNDGDVVVWT